MQQLPCSWMRSVRLRCCSPSWDADDTATLYAQIWGPSPFFLSYEPDNTNKDAAAYRSILSLFCLLRAAAPEASTRHTTASRSAGCPRFEFPRVFLILDFKWTVISESASLQRVCNESLVRAERSLPHVDLKAPPPQRRRLIIYSRSLLFNMRDETVALDIESSAQRLHLNRPPLSSEFSLLPPRQGPNVLFTVDF
ncbi:hypothetical protein EYF80_010749 [Liparis tanakae]|uniref:Uncharacterized protein n=1 Tax=Liparis tanakae TaxID=230148 RepID=A0A4Z2ILZ7_9TELE|nr:hypothetical protein EYF80_010749 [Liparis tanakae]